MDFLVAKTEEEMDAYVALDNGLASHKSGDDFVLGEPEALAYRKARNSAYFQKWYAHLSPEDKKIVERISKGL